MSPTAIIRKLGGLVLTIFHFAETQRRNMLHNREGGEEDISIRARLQHASQHTAGKEIRPTTDNKVKIKQTPLYMVERHTRACPEL